MSLIPITEVQFLELQAIFNSLTNKIAYQAPDNTKLIVVLSAPPLLQNGEWVEDTQENHSRIMHAALMGQAVGGALWEKRADSKKSAADFMPRLAVNADAQQLFVLSGLAKTNYPRDRVQTICCGNRGVANTRTQMEVMNCYGALSTIGLTTTDHVVFVTSLGHVPRAQLTADTVLPEICDFTYEVVAAPPYDLTDVLKADELAKIIKYALLGYLKLPD